MVEAALPEQLKRGQGPDALQQAMAYSLLAGGKRLRPVLVLAAAELGDLPVEAVLPAACAVEMIHTYSLIHDDLPAMDDDDYRRGRLTNHKVYGDAMAILAGDSLLTLAFQLVAETAADPRIGGAKAARACGELARAAGSAGMVGGQVEDLAWEGKQAGPEVLTAIHRGKTGALFAGSLKVGGILAGLTEEQLAALEQYAYAFGLAFQIQDDVLDVAGDSAKLGKTVGSDERKDKSTYVRHYGLEGAREKARQQVALAQAALAPFGPAADPLRALAAYVVERDH